MLNVAISGKRIWFATGVILEPKHWNVDKQTPRSSDPLRNAHLKLLARVSECVVRAYNNLQPLGTSEAITSEDIEQLKEAVRTFLAPEGLQGSDSTSFESSFEQVQVDCYAKRLGSIKFGKSLW